MEKYAPFSDVRQQGAPWRCDQARQQSRTEDPFTLAAPNSQWSLQLRDVWRTRLVIQDEKEFAG
jgi:hypothetical protein